MIDKNDIMLIVDGYPSSDLKTRVMIECLEKLKPLDFKILTTSHIPLSKEIQKLSDYVLVDNIDIRIKNFDRYDKIRTWHENDDFYVENIFDGVVYSHTPNVLVGIENAVRFALSKGFRYFLKFDYDFHLNKDDIHLVDKLIQSIGDKKSVLFGSPKFIATHVMFSDCYFYLSNMFPLNNEDDYFNNCRMIVNHTPCVELYLGSLFSYKKALDSIYFIETQPGYYFKKSKDNIINSSDLVNVIRVAKEEDVYYDDILSIVYSGYHLYDSYERIEIIIYKNNVEILRVEETPKTEFNFLNIKMEHGQDYEIHTYDTKNGIKKIQSVNTSTIDKIQSGYVRFKKGLNIRETS